MVVPSSTAFVNRSLSVCFQTYPVTGLLSSSPSLYLLWNRLPSKHFAHLFNQNSCCTLSQRNVTGTSWDCESRQVLLELPYATLPKQLWHFCDTCKGTHFAVFYYSVAHLNGEDWQSCTGQFQLIDIPLGKEKIPH